MNNMTLPTQEDIERIREDKLKTRSFFTVDLSNKTLSQKKPFKCWECGTRITTLRNEPLTMVEVEILPEDTSGKAIEGFCRPCNRVFIFI